VKAQLLIFDNLLRDDVGIRKIGAVFEAFVFEPQDVEVEFVSQGFSAAGLRALELLFVGEPKDRLGEPLAE
jgi:hypothetical protein